jgi:hypothetical protein
MYLGTPKQGRRSEIIARGPKWLEFQELGSGIDAKFT